MNRLFPYDTIDAPFDFRVLEVRLDGVVDPSLAPIDGVVDLSVLERPWNTIGLEVEALPPIAVKATDLGMTLVARCAPANARVAMALSRSRLDPGRWTGSIEVARAGFSGKVDLHCLLSGTVGQHPGRYLGESVEVVLHIDPPAIPLVTGAVPVRWVRFDADDAEPAALRRFAKEPFYIDVTEQGPIVLLNKGFPRLSGVLTDRRLPANAAALRDAVATGIAAQTWVAMFNAAAADVVRIDDDDPLDFPDGWRGDVLRRLLGQLYELESAESGLGMLRDAWSTDGGGSTQSLLVATVESHVGTGRRLRAGLEALKNDLASSMPDTDVIEVSA